MKPVLLSTQHTQSIFKAAQKQAEKNSLRQTRSDDSEMQMRNTTRATEQQPTEESSLHQTRSYDPRMQMRNTTRALNNNLLRVLPEGDYQARIEPEYINQEALSLLSELPVSLSESQITIESQTVQLEEFFSEIQDYMEKFAKGKGEYNQKYYNNQELRNLIQNDLESIISAKDFKTKLDRLEHLFEFYIEESTGQIEEKEVLESKVKKQDQEKLVLEQKKAELEAKIKEQEQEKEALEANVKKQGQEKLAIEKEKEKLEAKVKEQEKEKLMLEQEKEKFSDFMLKVINSDMRIFVEGKFGYDKKYHNYFDVRNRVEENRKNFLAQENFSKKIEVLRTVFKEYFKEATMQTMEIENLKIEKEKLTQEKEKLALEQEQKEKEYLDNISETVFTYHQDTSDLRAENKKQQEKLQETKHLLEEKTQEVALLDQQLKAETSKTEALESEIQKLKTQLEKKEVEVQRLNTAKEQYRKQAIESAENLKKHIDIYLNQNK